jgi:hypothetical protein
VPLVKNYYLEALQMKTRLSKKDIDKLAQMNKEVPAKDEKKDISFRVLVDGCGYDLVSGLKFKRGTNVINQICYWDWTKEMLNYLKDKLDKTGLNYRIVKVK